MKNSTLRQGLFILLGCLLGAPLGVEPSDRLPQARLGWTSEAYAYSGGRSGGGSFRSAPPSSVERSPSTQPSYPLSEESYGDSFDPYSPRTTPGYPRSSYPYENDWQYSQRPRSGPILIPVPSGAAPYNVPYGGGYTTTVDRDSGLLSLILFGGLGFAFVAAYLKAQSIRRSVGGSAIAPLEDELQNNTMTVSKVQVALLAVAEDVPAALTTLSSEANTQTREGLYQLLQESVLLLLRNAESWSHVSAVSQTVHRLEQAEVLFNQLSITERSKFKVETLTHVGGKLYKQTFTPPTDQDPAAYIVVTLLVGSAHDRPLFEGVRTEETLREALQNLAAIPPDYLMVFEVLWSPQASNDHLTYDEMLSEYASLIPL